MASINELTPEQKYSKDDEFHEPVLICDSCNELVLATTLRNVGSCNHCGNRKVRNVRVLSEENMEIARAWASAGKIDPDWLKLFEACEE